MPRGKKWLLGSPQKQLRAQRQHSSSGLAGTGSRAVGQGQGPRFPPISGRFSSCVGSGIWKGPGQLPGKLPIAFARHQVTGRPWAKPCPVCSLMKLEGAGRGAPLCVKSKMPALNSLAYFPRKEPPSLWQPRPLPLRRKGHDQALPWHPSREGPIYSIRVQGLTLLPQRLNLLSSAGSELVGVQPQCLEAPQPGSFLFILECSSRCGCCGWFFFFPCQVYC